MGSNIYYILEWKPATLLTYYSTMGVFLRIFLHFKSSYYVEYL